MEENKTFVLVVDGVFAARITVFQSNTLGQLTDYLEKNYPGNLTIFINKGVVLSTEEEFRDKPMSFYWPHIVFGVFHVRTLEFEQEVRMAGITLEIDKATKTQRAEEAKVNAANVGDVSDFINVQSTKGITTQCVKVESLRKTYPPSENIDLEKWMAKPGMLLVSRHGRIFIKQPDGSNKTFHYPASKWANPYKVSKDCSLEQSLNQYKQHVLNSNLKNELHELHGKTLGCFCDQSGACHAKVLVQLAERYN